MKDSWFVYIVQCSDNSLYTGITCELDARINHHNHSPKGAKYTRSRRPVILVYSKKLPSKSEALKEEYRIKKLAKHKKLALISNINTSEN